MRWERLHPTTISQKVQIIVEHFHANVAHLLEGKAMAVTDSRKAAVKYKKAIDASIAKRAAADPSYSYRTLVAFSGSVRMDEDEVGGADWGPPPGKDDELTETNRNHGAGADLAAAFKGQTNKITLVANKFQTGFDQPLLSAMYVDKKLSGVTVQTLSQAAVTAAVVDNQGAHNTMADYFFSDGPGINGVIVALADAFYEAATDRSVDV